MHSTGEPVFENGKVMRLIGNTLDITEQENATQELQRSEAYLAEAQRLSHTGSFGWKPDTGEIIWSAETYRIFEYDRAVTPTMASWYSVFIQRTAPTFSQSLNMRPEEPQISSMPIVCCCPMAESSMSKPWLTQHRMHRATANLWAR